MVTATAGAEFLSSGRLAVDVQRTVNEILKMAQKLGIKPAMRLNRVPYFSNEQCEQITAAFRKQREETGK